MAPYRKFVFIIISCWVMQCCLPGLAPRTPYGDFPFSLLQPIWVAFARSVIIKLNRGPVTLCTRIR